MKYLKGIINTPPKCDICDEPMQAEVCSAEVDFEGTSLTQLIARSCPNCYDPLSSIREK